MAEVAHPRLPKHWQMQWDTSGSGHPLTTPRAQGLFLRQGKQQTAPLDFFKARTLPSATRGLRKDFKCIKERSKFLCCRVLAGYLPARQRATMPVAPRGFGDNVQMVLFVQHLALATAGPD